MTDKQEQAWESLQERIANKPYVDELHRWYSDVFGQEETARSLLRSGYFFHTLVADFEKAGLVNEKRNALATYVIGTSRLRKAPLNEIVKGSSSAGKNFLVKTVFKFIPPGAVVPASSLSEHAIHYAGKNALRHKIFYLDELGVMSHPARQLISEGRTIHRVSAMENGTRVTKEHVTEGPVSCITTTTQDAVQIDDESRNFSIWINESHAQTKAISKALVATGREILTKERLAIWHEVQNRIAEIKNVHIATPPWFEDVVEKILPYGDVRIRRYWPAFVEACKVVCMIRSASLDKNEVMDGLTVKFRDFGVTNIIFDRIIAQSLTRAGRDEEMATAEIVDDLVRERAGCSIGVSAGDLVGQPGIRTLDRAYKLLRQAERAGTIRQSNIPRKNNEKFYVRAEPATFLGPPEQIVTKIGLKISGHFIHPFTGHGVHYGRQ
jgi:hypothetical protein